LTCAFDGYYRAVGALGGLHGFTVPLTSFVGRAAEVAEVADLLAAYRMVTVAGMGGVGKTRLAGEVARKVAGRYADGAWLVELGAVEDGSLVPAAVAAMMGLPQASARSPVESLCAALARRQLLLVLDNCEHVLDAAAGLCRAVLLAADDVRVLATSREPLRIAGEARFRLQPFAVPSPCGAAASDSDAVNLFTNRARQADPHFCLDERSGPLAAQVVTRLDGVPLAIELAAARIEVLGLDQLAERQDHSLQLLTSSDRAAAPRHQSLAATVEWSYRLLSDTEQRVFRHLAVFPGPFTLQAAVAVAGAGAEPAVLRLVDCSLLTPPRTGPDGRSRYTMLETLRAFGRDRLADPAEASAAASGLARHALAIAEEAAADMQFSAGELRGVGRLDAEDPSLRQALAWALEHDPDMALRLAVALTPWRIMRGRHEEAYAQISAAARQAAPGTARWAEAQYWLGQAVAKSDQGAALAYYRAASEALGDGPPTPVLVWALAGQSNMLNIIGRPEGMDLADRALAVAREASHPCSLAFALMARSQAAQLAGDLNAAADCARQASRIDPATIPGDFARDCHTTLAVVLIDVGDLEAARVGCAELLALSRQAGDLTTEAVGLFLVADLELRAGRLAEARKQLDSAVRLAVEIHHRIQLMVCLPVGAELCAAAGLWADMVTLYAARQAAAEAGGAVIGSAHTAARREELMRRAATELPPAELRRAEQRGTAMTLVTAAEFLLIATAADRWAPIAADEPYALSRLSPREQELVALVAGGRTDAQIAGELYISVSTVRSHLERIRDKTSCRRRADLTRLALQAGLA
jgi:predicted ATPase/DNA-binding CsgD family transcriptional regulator